MAKHQRLPVKEKLLRQHHFRCAWCSHELTYQAATLDHVLCVTAGGSDWIGNLLPSCSDCNWYRGDTDAETWMKLCLLAGKNVRKRAVRKAIQRSRYDRRSDHVSWLAFKEGTNSVNFKRHLIAKRKRRALDGLCQAINALSDLPPDYYEEALSRQI